MTVMRVHDMIVDERRRAAELFASLSADQLSAASLCEGWTVHEVAAHLTTFLRLGQAKLYLGILATGADIDRVNRWLTRRAGGRPIDEIAETLHRWAGARTTIPRSGYDPVLTDLVLHDLDVRHPLGIARRVPEERLWVAFQHLTRRPSPGFTMGSRLRNLRLVAADTGWTHGAGPVVRGGAEALLLAIGGRAVGLDDLDGDGVPLLRERVAAPSRGALGARLGSVLKVLTDPPPKERRTRAATVRTS